MAHGFDVWNAGYVATAGTTAQNQLRLENVAIFVNRAKTLKCSQGILKWKISTFDSYRKEGVITKTDDRFKYNMGLEIVMQQLFGSKHYGGIAAGFTDASYTRKCLLHAVERIRNRFDEIPMDERLTANLGRSLDNLEKEVRRISKSGNFDWFLITDLLILIVYLLGYDRLDGKVHRSVVYFQDKGQEQEDCKWLVGDREYYDTYRLEQKRRYMLVNQLSRNKVPKYQIAKLLGLSTKRVNQILSEIPEIEKSIGKSIPSFE